MELRYKKSFKHDIDIHNKEILKALWKLISDLKSSKSTSEIYGLKKLKYYKVHYRIKLLNDYRVGVIIRGNIIWLVCFGHRSNFYKNFP